MCVCEEGEEREGGREREREGEREREREGGREGEADREVCVCVCGWIN